MVLRASKLVLVTRRTRCILVRLRVSGVAARIVVAGCGLDPARGSDALRARWWVLYRMRSRWCVADNLNSEGLSFGAGTGFGIPTWLMLLFFVAVMAAFACVAQHLPRGCTVLV